MNPSSQSPSELTEEEAEIQERLPKKEGPAPDFEPVVIRGESSSETILRERR